MPVTRDGLPIGVTYLGVGHIAFQVCVTHHELFTGLLDTCFDIARLQLCLHTDISTPLLCKDINNVKNTVKLTCFGAEP